MNPKNRKSKTNSSKVPKKKSHKPKKTAGKKKTTSPNLRKKTIKKIPLGHCKSLRCRDSKGIIGVVSNFV
ncbi:hypothetical protein MAL01_19290 (plasmid) [Leptospira noguchii]|uniref:hypothetical protein n=1 Tax=Leptospira noguchii TaxID=28182 RepID=UPI001FB76663|nr:hypothetical protein [Leptospira noguchii]UOG36213.1 hypothetical protein MAL02_18890 [Leptospira noguchii]UOG47176.1 hypothetical protein MAL01_19290 [Leptospira noguchii]